MYRGSRATTNQPNPTTNKYNTPQLPTVSKILSSFITYKQKINMKEFIERAKLITNNRKKAERMMLAILKGLFSRKTLTYTKLAYRRMRENMAGQKMLEAKALEQRKNKMKNSSATLIAILYRKLQTKCLKTTLSVMKRQSRLKHHSQNFKVKHLFRILNTLYMKKLEKSFSKIREQKIKYLMKKIKLMAMGKMLSQKLAFNKKFALLKLSRKNQPQTETKVQKISGPGTKSRVKQTKAMEESSMEEDPALAAKQRELEEKNKKIKQEIEKLKKQNEKIISDYQKEIAVYEKEHEELKFNNDLLDQGNRELQTELLQRQKKSTKRMSNADLWEHVYSNLLLMIKRAEGETLPKETVLECLETPLASINVDLDAMRMENEILSELLEEYKKFYEGSEPPEQPVDDLLPFDILASKNKFLYAAAEALISQGVGSEAEIKQLQSDLDNLCKHG